MPSPLTTSSRRLSRALARLRFSAPVAVVYNPLQYAREPWERYLERHGAAPKKTILVGMNPGPWGMAQTGVPFGDIGFVRDWLGISGTVTQPPTLHPKRPVMGYDVTRGEVSGRRLWGWARDRFGSPEQFFDEFFVANYCPLAFFGETGTNVTPDKLRKADREALYRACDRALCETIEALSPELVVGIGAFAATRVAEATAAAGLPVRTGRITHPSPANPKANKGWVPLIEKELREMRRSEV